MKEICWYDMLRCGGFRFALRFKRRLVEAAGVKPGKKQLYQLVKYELLPYTVEIAFKGHNVYVLNLETMVALKRGAAIPKEQYRLQIYEETVSMKNENGDKF